MTEVRGSPKRIRDQTKRYVRENWGFPFIVAFILLLLVAAIFLVTSNYYASIATSVVDESARATFLMASLNLASLAEGIASCAYIVLVVGVVLLLGKVNSSSVHECIVKIKKLKVISKCIRFGKSRLNKGVKFYGSD